MARVTAKGVTEIAADPVGVLTTTCKDLNAFIVLKGAHSLIGYPDERVYINMSGNSGMATAGSGDVLTGAIGAMYGLGCPVPEAVRMGVFVHGLAGDLAAEDLGEDGITAQDILAYLPRAMRTIRRGLDEASADRYLGMRIV
jgi:NAD(P)H-hydrate epimerase